MSTTLDRNHEYMVRNYTASPVVVATRDTEYVIPGGTRSAPAEFPLSLSEIMYINSATELFKSGVLRFDEADEAAIYDALRITNWREILRLEDIDDIILRPTTEKLNQVLAIKSYRYFDRIYGEYIMLKNTGHAISGSVEQVVKLRKQEFQRGVIDSEIKVSAVDDTAQRQAETDSQIKALQDQIAALTKMLAEKDAASDKVQDVVATPAVQKPAGKKPAAKNATTKSTKGS